MDEIFLILQGLWYLFVVAFFTVNAFILFVMLKAYLEIRRERKQDEAILRAVEEFRS